MHFLPICFPELSRLRIQGRVAYPNCQIEIPQTAVDERFGQNLDYFIRLIAGNEPPPKAPSTGECRFCDVTSADCPDRYSLARVQKAAN